MWVGHVLFISSLADVHLGCFHFGAIMNNNSVNIHVEVFSVHICFWFLGIYIGVELLDNMINLCLTF